MDPCTDFYEFSCGSWETNNLGHEKDQFTQAYEKMLLFFSDILQSPLRNNSNLKVINIHFLPEIFLIKVFNFFL